MTSKVQRHPFKNFFLKKSLQYKIITRILFIIFLTSCMTTLLLSFMYNTKSQDGSFYYMSNDIRQDLELTSILGIILPALITAQIVSLIIAVVIGMFSSRKAAVPVYKLEKWAIQLKKGRLKTQLGFREITEMKDLTIQCNALADTYRHIFKEIDTALENIQGDRVYKSQVVTQELAQIRSILGKIDYKD